MVPLTRIIGRPVVSLNDGQELGHVQEVVYDAYRGLVLGFRLNREGWFGRPRALLFEDVYSLGEDAITIPTADLLSGEGSAAGEATPLPEQHESILGKRLLTQSGEFIGAVDDVLVDRRTGAGVGYQVSGGLFERAGESGCLLQLPRVTLVGVDYAIVPDEVRTSLAGTDGEAASTTGESVVGTASAPRGLCFEEGAWARAAAAAIAARFASASQAAQEKVAGRAGMASGPVPVEAPVEGVTAVTDVPEEAIARQTRVSQL